jgi:hypothetical protein
MKKVLLVFLFALATTNIVFGQTEDEQSNANSSVNVRVIVSLPVLPCFMAQCTLSSRWYNRNDDLIFSNTFTSDFSTTYSLLGIYASCPLGPLAYRYECCVMITDCNNYRRYYSGYLEPLIWNVPGEYNTVFIYNWTTMGCQEWLSNHYDD